MDVISEEQTSQTYLMPPSVPRVPVFFLITPMAPHDLRAAVKEGSHAGSTKGTVAVHWKCACETSQGWQDDIGAKTRLVAVTIVVHGLLCYYDDGTV